MDAISSLGTLFSGPVGKLAELGAAGAGGIGNILNDRARSNELKQVQADQNLASNPAALAKEVAATTQPLNSGLVQSVGNQVSGTLAEQGLAEAPGIQASVLSQSLAPFEQQNQNTALQLVLQKLGLPAEYAQTYLAGLPKNANLAPLLALLQSKGTAATQPNIAAILNLIRSSNGPQNQPTSESTFPNTLQDPGIDYNFAPGATWVPPAISDLPSVAPTFGG